MPTVNVPNIEKKGHKTKIKVRFTGHVVFRGSEGRC